MEDLGLVAGGFMVIQVFMNSYDEGQQVQNEFSPFGNLYDSLFDTSLNIDILKSCNYISPTDFIAHNKLNKDFQYFPTMTDLCLTNGMIFYKWLMISLILNFQHYAYKKFGH